MPVCAAIEEELSQLEDADKLAFLADMGLEEPGLNRVIRAGLPSLRIVASFCNTGRLARASLSFALAARSTRASALSTESRSASASSVSIVSMSEIGSILPATWTMSVFSKQRTTCAIASTSRICARNLLPSPSPFDAPATRPAMSTNSIEVGMTLSGLAMPASASRRGSGTGTTPMFGSIVQNGKFAAAMPALVSALKRDAQPQPVKLAMPEMGEGVTQAVLAAVAAVELEPRRASRQVEIVVGDEHFLRLDLPVAQSGLDRDAALVHVSRRLEQPKGLAVENDFRRLAMQLRLHAETRAVGLSQGVNKPEPGVVPGSQVFGTGIAQADE